ncbi:membrane protein insertion efficiency factor YidD [Gramella sp. KN1008]|nr:membrane protein insertion efficiency factor YidD [Gramella sp. KN1008]
MRYFFLLLVKVCFRIYPVHKKTRCIFKENCSSHIRKSFKERGSIQGLKSIWFRYRNCRPGFSLLKNPRTNEINMLLRTNTIVTEDKIADHLITEAQSAR